MCKHICNASSIPHTPRRPWLSTRAVRAPALPSLVGTMPAMLKPPSLHSTCHLQPTRQIGVGQQMVNANKADAKNTASFVQLVAPAHSTASMPLNPCLGADAARSRVVKATSCKCSQTLQWHCVHEQACMQCTQHCAYPKTPHLLPTHLPSPPGHQWQAGSAAPSAPPTYCTHHGTDMATATHKLPTHVRLEPH